MAAKEVLLGLMNDLNQPKRLFSDVNVELGDAVPELTENGDTKLLVTAVPGRGYNGSVEVFYRRIPLADAIGDKSVRSLNELTPQVVIDLVNSAAGSFVSLDDLVPFATPTPEEGTATTIVLTAKPESLGFTGTIEITVEYGRSWLDTVVGVRVLGIMQHPIALIGKQSARMLSWGKDFTCLRDALKPDKTGQITDWDRLQTACAAMGIPSWYKGYTIYDRAVADVPDANPRFDRVFIQSYTYSNFMEGQLYFHYNVLEEV